MGAAAFGAIIDRLRRIVPNLGSVFFVDCDAGIDLPGRGTFALPLRTIDYGISNYAMAWRNDAFICWGSAGGGFNENVNLDGVQVDVPGVVISAYNNVRIDNTNAAGTSIFNVTVNQCWILGFRVQPMVAKIGILNSGVNTKVGYEDFQNIFDNCTVDVRTTGANGHYRYNEHINSSIGYDLRSTRNEIYNNHMESAGAGGTIGITTTGAGDRNFIRENVVFGYATGINMVAGAIGNVMVENSLHCAVNKADANNVNVNAWIHNKSRSRINHTNTVQEDLKDIFDEAEGGGGEAETTRVGDVSFVSTTGSNVNGDGSLGNPWLTIDFAVGQCVANHNDMIVVFSPNNAEFDENVNAGGVLVDVAGINVIAVNNAQVTNSNVVAISVFNVTAARCNIEGFNIRPQVGATGIIVAADNTTLKNDYVNAVGGAVGIQVREDNVLITGGKIIDANLYGIEFVNNAARGVVKEVIFQCPAGTGVLFSDGAVNNEVDHCDFIGDGALGGVAYDNDGTAGRNTVKNSNIIVGLVNASGTNGPVLVSNNMQDKFDFVHTIQIADGVAEITVLELTPVRTGRYSVQADVNTLVVAEAGKTVRLRLYHMIDNANRRRIGYQDFIAGVDEMHPTVTGYVEGGYQNVRLTIQMNAAVVGARVVNFKVTQEG